MSLIKRITNYHKNTPEWLCDIKYKALKESPFRFFRGVNHIFAEELFKMYTPTYKAKTWMCGDLHFENFGSYKAENRQIYFDITDFDDAMLATPEPDIIRFLTGIIISGNHMNMPLVKVHKATHDILDAYIEAIAARKALLPDVTNMKGDLKRFFTDMSTVDRQSFIEKRTTKHKGSLYIKTNGENYIEIEEEEKLVVYDSLAVLLNKHPDFSDFVFEDAAIRIAGTGSLGLNRYGVLVFSRKKGKHYLLDIKESRHSCYQPLVGIKQPRHKHDVNRILTACFIMPYLRPAFVATIKLREKLYLVKELQPSMDRMRITDFTNDFGTLVDVAKQMAALLAYAQLRSCGHFGASTADDLVKHVDKAQWQKDVTDVSGALAIKMNKYYKHYLGNI